MTEYRSYSFKIYRPKSYPLVDMCDKWWMRDVARRGGGSDMRRDAKVHSGVAADQVLRCRRTLRTPQLRLHRAAFLVVINDTK